MKTVGQILRENREIKNISLDFISNELKISSSVLKDLENDTIKKTPDIVFLVGHLRSYSNFLDLNTSELITSFKKQLSFHPEELSKTISKPSFDNKKFNLAKYSAASLMIIIFTSFYLLFLKQDNSNVEYALIPEVPEIFIPDIEEMELNLALNKNIKLTEESIDNNFSSANASIDTNDDQFLTNTVTLKFLNSTWIQVRDKSENIIISKLMQKDEEYSYSIDLKYNITAGNAGNILVLVDNDVRGKLGKYGEVLDSFIINNNFDN